MEKKFYSELAEESHKTMTTLHRLGMIDKQTMHDFDKLCQVHVQSLTAEEIRELRMREGVSQPVLAWHLNVSKNLVSDWERGTRRPGGAALKLLNIVQRKGLEAIAL